MCAQECSFGTKPPRKTSNTRVKCECLWHVKGATEGSRIWEAVVHCVLRGKCESWFQKGDSSNFFLSGSRQVLDKRLQEYLSTGSLPLEPVLPIPRTLGALRRQPVPSSMHA